MRLVPCATQFEAHDGSLVGGDESCVWDEDEVKDYIGSAFSILVYHNQNEFREDKYGDYRVVKNSVLTPMYSVTKNAVYTEAFITKYELYDEVDFF